MPSVPSTSTSPDHQRVGARQWLSTILAPEVRPATLSIPVQGTATVSARDDGTLVVVKVTVWLEPDAAIDLVLPLIGAIQRARGARP